jgi:hypothetical protein
MKNMLKRMGAAVSKLHRDQDGAEGLEKLLIIAAVVLPLLGLLIWFRNDIKEWVANLWQGQKGEAQNWQNNP